MSYTCALPLILALKTLFYASSVDQTLCSITKSTIKKNKRKTSVSNYWPSPRPCRKYWKLSASLTGYKTQNRRIHSHISTKKISVNSGYVFSYYRLLHKIQEPPIRKYNKMTRAINTTLSRLIHSYSFRKEHENSRQFFQLSDVTSGLKGHSLKLFKPRCRTTITQNFFSLRVINEWNKLPQEVVDAPSVNMFNNRLDRYWKDMGVFS